MDNLLIDSAKISFYAQIQKLICELSPNSTDEEINNLFSKIPEESLNQEDDLIIICQLFAYYPRNSPKKVRRNAFKLFDKIMKPLKLHLQDHSSFFWNIFGGLYYFKHYMYESGLITIDKIIQESLYDRSPAVAEFFLPEIIENRPELFEKEIKHKIRTPYTESYLKEYKELRQKHLKWLRESNDYKDPIYREIEKNQLRYSIKTDDIDTFQTILSNLNMSVNADIEESVLENSYFQPARVSLIDFAIEFDSINIFKYLIMNNAKIQMESIFNSIRNQNYEMIHIVEANCSEKFHELSLANSISCWNNEMAIYSIDNYDSTLEEDEISKEKAEKVFDVISEISYSINFQFFESFFLPFMKTHSKFIKENINEIVYNTLQDQSAFFTKKFMSFPGFDVNYHSKHDLDKSLLCKAIQLKNFNATELFLNHPDIDIVNPGCGYASQFQFACGCYANSKVLKMFCDKKDFDIDWIDTVHDFSALDICILRNNFEAIDFILTNFPDFEESIDLSLFLHCLRNHHFVTLKMILEYMKIHNEERLKDITAALPMCKEYYKYQNELAQIFNDLKIDCLFN